MRVILPDSATTWQGINLCQGFDCLEKFLTT
jgi:hypothetical protein